MDKELSALQARPADPETYVAGVVVWSEVTSTSNQAEIGILIPASSPHCAGQPANGTLWIVAGTAAIIVLVPPVPAPFIKITAHVINTERIGIFGSNWM